MTAFILKASHIPLYHDEPIIGPNRPVTESDQSPLYNIFALNFVEILTSISRRPSRLPVSSKACFTVLSGSILQFGLKADLGSDTASTGQRSQATVKDGP